MCEQKNTMEVDIDRFDLMYWLEGCARGSHLRQGIWNRCVDEFYGKLTQESRNFVFHYSVRDLWDIFNDGEDTAHNCGKDDFNMFIDGFNPYNRYEVISEYEGEEETNECFYHMGYFHIDSKRSLIEDYIKSVKWIGKEASDKYYERYKELSYELKERVSLEAPYKGEKLITG